MNVIFKISTLDTNQAFFEKEWGHLIQAAVGAFFGAQNISIYCKRKYLHTKYTPNKSASEEDATAQNEGASFFCNFSCFTSSSSSM